MKNRKNYVTTKSNLTLTQSGLLAVLLQRQRHKSDRVGPTLPTREAGASSFWSTLTRQWRALTARTLSLFTLLGIVGLAVAIMPVATVCSGMSLEQVKTDRVTKYPSSARQCRTWFVEQVLSQLP